jgi:hypothetical protein
METIPGVHEDQTTPPCRAGTTAARLKAAAVAPEQAPSLRHCPKIRERDHSQARDRRARRRHALTASPLVNVKRLSLFICGPLTNEPAAQDRKARRRSLRRDRPGSAVEPPEVPAVCHLTELVMLAVTFV